MNFNYIIQSLFGPEKSYLADLQQNQVKRTPQDYKNQY